MPKLRRQDFLSEEDYQDWLVRDTDFRNSGSHVTKAWWAKKHKHSKRRKPRRTKFDSDFYDE